MGMKGFHLLYFFCTSKSSHHRQISILLFLLFWFSGGDRCPAHILIHILICILLPLNINTVALDWMGGFEKKSCDLKQFREVVSCPLGFGIWIEFTWVQARWEVKQYMVYIGISLVYGEHFDILRIYTTCTARVLAFT